MGKETFGLRNSITTIGITIKTKEKIKKMADEMKFKQITILEYLLNGKININELKKYD